MSLRREGRSNTVHRSETRFLTTHTGSLIQQSGESGPVVMPGLTVRLSESPLVLGRAAGRAGSDAESILAEVGLAGRMTELSRAWVLRTEDLPRAW